MAIQVRKLVEPVVDQLIAIVQRDQAATLNFIEPALPIFEDFKKGPGPRLTLPTLTVYCSGLDFDPAVELTQHWFAQIALVADVGDYDQDNALHLCYQYSRALHAIIESASGPDWETAISATIDGITANTVPVPSGTIKLVRTESIAFEEGAPEGRTNSTARVRMTVRFEAEEA